MPLTTASFSVTESLANNNVVTFTDTSSGTDNTLTVRTIEIKLANGNWLDENGNESTTQVFITWPYVDTSIILDILSQSTATTIIVRWFAGSTEAYISEDVFCFNLYDYLFMLQVLQGNTSAPNQIQDTNFYSNSIQFIVNLFNEENSIDPGADIYSSQNAMNQNLLMINNESLFF